MKKHRVANDILQALGEFSTALKRGDNLADTFTSRKVELQLEPGEYDAKNVKAVRKLLCASQTVFAQFLGVSPKTVRGWEQGRIRPSDMACRFLDEIQRNPEYWRKRLRESAVVKTKAGRTS